MNAPSFSPMLAGYGPPSSVAGWSAEPKLDGWRALVTVDGDRATVRTRGGHDLELPELSPMSDIGLRLVLDGELVGGAGRMSDFYAIAPTVSMRRRTRRPTLSFAAFDVLWIDGTSTIDLPYLHRRRLLDQLGLNGPATIVPTWDGEDAADLLAACEHLDVEGVVLKRHDSTYQPGRRSTMWRKVKCPTWRDQHAERRRPPERWD